MIVRKKIKLPCRVYNNLMKLSFVFLPLFLFICNNVLAQDPEYVPTAIFLQINTGTNRLKYYAANNQTKDLELMGKDLVSMKKAIIGDFTANFDLLPIYYFNDTNLSKILARNFDGVLLDKDDHPIPSQVLARIDSNFFIAYYGTPVRMNKDEKTGEMSTPAVVEIVEHGWVVVNNLDVPLPRFPYFTSCSGLRRQGPYGFSSENFDMDYKTSAHRLQKRLNFYFFTL